MIKALRRRFIIGSMLALLILLLLLIGSISITSYVNMEKNDKAFMQSILNGEPAPDNSRRAQVRKAPHNPDSIPRRDHFQRSFYLVDINTDGSIKNVAARGIWNEDIEEAESIALQAMDTGKSYGTLAEQYKFMLRSDETGTRLILMNSSFQINMLKDTIRTAAMFSLFALAAMFLILLPVSSQVVRSYAQNAEKQKQFITNAGHELKTPLAIILSNLDAMELIAGENKWSRNIRGQSERLNSLLSRLLFLSRINENSMQVKKEKFSFADMLRGEITAYDQIIAEKHLYFESSIGELPEISGNRDYLCQLLHVLLDNAVQYTPYEGQIIIDLHRNRRRIIFTIENSVEQLPADPPESLFERFFRGDSAHSQSGGHGIGLSAARAIAEMHGGSIHAVYGEQSVKFITELKA